LIKVVPQMINKFNNYLLVTIGDKKK